MSETPNMLGQAIGQIADELLGFLIAIVPGILLFWILPSWLIPILFGLGGFVWAMMWLGMRKRIDSSSGLQILAYIVLMVLLVVGLIPDLHDVIVLSEKRVVSVQYEEELMDIPALSVIRFEGWEVDMDYYTKFSRRVSSSSSNTSTMVTSHMVPLRRKRKAQEEVYAVVVEGALPLSEDPKTYWQRPDMAYGFIPNKLERLGHDRETVERMEEKGVKVHPEAVFIELFDSPQGKAQQVFYYLKVKVGVAGLIWLLMHLGVLIYRVYKSRQ